MQVEIVRERLGWVNKYRFQTLFTSAERQRYRAAVRAVAALPQEPVTPDELLLDQFADFLDQFNALPDTPDTPGVNLADPKLPTALGGLFVALGIIEPGEAEARVAAILADQDPPE